MAKKIQTPEAVETKAAPWEIIRDLIENGGATKEQLMEACGFTKESQLIPQISRLRIQAEGRGDKYPWKKGDVYVFLNQAEYDEARAPKERAARQTLTPEQAFEQANKRLTHAVKVQAAARDRAAKSPSATNTTRAAIADLNVQLCNEIMAEVQAGNFSSVKPSRAQKAEGAADGQDMI